MAIPDRSGAISPAVAARLAGRSETTIKRWAEQYHIGHRVVGRWEISRLALTMLLDGNEAALNDYLACDRIGPRVTAYLSRSVRAA